MRNLSKKWVSLMLIFTLVMAIFMPTMVNATTTITQGNKIVNTTTSETLTFDGKEHNSTVYAGEIKKDGVTVLNYLYSSDITRSSVVFDNLRQTLSTDFSNLVPTIANQQDTSGMKELTVSTLNGVDLSTITGDWTNASNIATQVYNGTNTDIVNSNMYDVDNGFKAEIDNNTTERSVLDNPMETNKRIISHIGTQTSDDVNFQVVDGNLMEIHNVNLIYLSEATTVIYTSVNVTTTPATPTKINTINATIKAPEVGTTIVDDSTKPNITLDSNANYTVSWTMYVNNYPSVDPTYDDGAIFGTTVEDGKEYYLEVYLTPKEGYQFDTASNVTLKVNGGTEYELGYCSENQFSFFTKVKASKSSENTVGSLYKILDGAGQTHLVTGGQDLVVRADGDISKFVSLKVDNKVVDASNYTTKSGSTIAVIKTAFLDTLPSGTHTLTFVYTDGEVSTTFKTEPAVTSNAQAGQAVSAESGTAVSTNNPKTGDNIYVYYVLMLVTILGIYGTTKYIKANKK